MAENIKIEVLNNFDRNIILMEDACSTILLEILQLKNLPNNMTHENQSNSNIQVTMIKQRYELIVNIQGNRTRIEQSTKAQEEKINILVKRTYKNEKILSSLSQTIERQPKAQTSQLKPPNPPLGTIGPNMIHIKRFGKAVKDKYLGEKSKMN